MTEIPYRAATEHGLAAAPVLLDGDVIQIKTSVDRGWTQRDTFTVLGLVTSGAIAVVQFLRLIDADG